MIFPQFIKDEIIQGQAEEFGCDTILLYGHIKNKKLKEKLKHDKEYLKVMLKIFKEGDLFLKLEKTNLFKLNISPPKKEFFQRLLFIWKHDNSNYKKYLTKDLRYFNAFVIAAYISSTNSQALKNLNTLKKFTPFELEAFAKTIALYPHKNPKFLFDRFKRVILFNGPRLKKKYLKELLESKIYGIFYIETNNKDFPNELSFTYMKLRENRFYPSQAQRFILALGYFLRFYSIEFKEFKEFISAMIITHFANRFIKQDNYKDLSKFILFKYVPIPKWVNFYKSETKIFYNFMQFSRYEESEYALASTIEDRYSLNQKRWIIYKKLLKTLSNNLIINSAIIQYLKRVEYLKILSFTNYNEPIPINNHKTIPRYLYILYSKYPNSNEPLLKKILTAKESEIEKIKEVIQKRAKEDKESLSRHPINISPLQKILKITSVTEKSYTLITFIKNGAISLKTFITQTNLPYNAAIYITYNLIDSKFHISKKIKQFSQKIIKENIPFLYNYLNPIKKIKPPNVYKMVSSKELQILKEKYKPSEGITSILFIKELNLAKKH
jgi:hypothetical protein